MNEKLANNNNYADEVSLIDARMIRIGDSIAVKSKTVKPRYWSKILNKFVMPMDDILKGVYKDPSFVVNQPMIGEFDSNGKQIYEDDIVHTDTDGTVTTIGNIYENPEL